MSATHFSGPVVSANGFQASASGTQIKNILKGTVSVTVAALAASTAADVSVTITGAAAGDTILITPTNAAMETNLEICAAWVSAANTVKIRMRNFHASSALTGSTSAWTYQVVQS